MNRMNRMDRMNRTLEGARERPSKVLFILSILFILSGCERTSMGLQVADPAWGDHL
jgi:uncharacterized lipoprotein YajG